MHPGIPHSALLAEIQAFPFWAPAAFAARLVALSQTAPGILDGGSAQVARALEAELLPRAGGLSVDALVALRDQAWFAGRAGTSGNPKPGRTRALVDILVDLASDHLAWMGNLVQLRLDADPAATAERWRWLTLYLPQDLLVAALLAGRDGPEPPSEYVQLVSPPLTAILRQPCAETHLHLGAAVTFSMLWENLTVVLQRGDPAALDQMPPVLLADRFQARQALLAAVIVRLLLAAFLWRREAGRLQVPFQVFLSCPDAQGLPAICDRIATPRRGDAAPPLRLCWQVLRYLQRPRDVPAQLPAWRWLYRELLGTSRRAPVDADPLTAWLVARCGLATAETRFACRAIRYLRNKEGRADALFSLLFLQYHRLRTQLYRYLVQTPGTRGLDWFTRYYNRIWPIRRSLDGRLLGHALRLESRDLSLRALEVRQSPAADWGAVRDRLRSFAEQAWKYDPPSGMQRPEVGLVLHFIKARERRQGSARFLHADPQILLYGCRHAIWYLERAAEAGAIATALDQHPELLLVLRGLDVANTELAQPTWVLLSLWQRVRQAASRAAARLAQRRPSWEVTPLRTTLHAGEDFIRLIEGLRRIHEPIDYGLLGMGDRIGHALALGIDPKRWAVQARVLHQPKEDRLDDLLWEFERYQRAELPVEPRRIEYVRFQAGKIGRELYGEDAGSVEDLVYARQLRHQPGLMRELQYPYLRSRRRKLTAEKGPYRLLWRYLTDRGVFVRGQQPELVTCDDNEVAFLGAAQAWLAGELHRLALTVESNPSSNLLIGGMDSMQALPSLWMHPPGERPGRAGGPLLVSINTDNPVTFASCLADEMAYMYFGLLRYGAGATDALDWIDRAREAGWRSRFTLPASADPQSLAQLRAPRPPR